MSEQRKFSRVGFDTRVTLGNEEALWEAHVIDISLNGLLIERPDNWTGALDDEFDMDLLLNDVGDAFVVMRCKVAWLSDNRVGLERTEIGVESITHLRQILELNTGDPDRVHREFASLGVA